MSWVCSLKKESEEQSSHSLNYFKGIWKNVKADLCSVVADGKKRDVMAQIVTWD